MESEIFTGTGTSFDSVPVPGRGPRTGPGPRMGRGLVIRRGKTQNCLGNLFIKFKISIIK